ncbi:MAG: hypothetical protein VX467_04310 [Verrucomicrobiota bacterium]|nr:hypothetical protein [Verrucomicrobiota bacterium]
MNSRNILLVLSINSVTFLVILSILAELEFMSFKYCFIIISLILNLSVISFLTSGIIRGLKRTEVEEEENKFTDMMTDLDEELKRRKNKEKLERN